MVTSDVRRQILMVNRKIKEEWDKKQAVEAEKQRKLNEVSICYVPSYLPSLKLFFLFV